MIKLKFNSKDIDELRYERFHHPSVKIQQKMEALYLKSMGLRHNEICRLCEISKTTLIAYLREYEEGGIPNLKRNTKYKGAIREVKPSKLRLKEFQNNESYHYA